VVLFERDREIRKRANEWERGISIILFQYLSIWMKNIMFKFSPKFGGVNCNRLKVNG
jgi:hypothetical protein